VIPLRPRRAGSWRSPAVRALAAAAVLAAVAVVPVLRSRANGSGWRDPATLAALATKAGNPLPLSSEHPWPVMRGEDVSATLTGTSARVGALHVDLVITASSSAVADTIVSQFADQLANTLDGANLPGSNSVIGEYQEIADSTHWSDATRLERLAAARRDVMDFVETDYFAAGAWTEAARVAALRENAAFFSTPETRKAVEKMSGLKGLRDEGKAAVARLRERIGNQREVQDWPALQNDLDTLLRELAR
jgi:hypothetical protein